MFLSLKHLDAITVSLFLTLTPIVVLIIATLFLHEIHSKIDLIFIFLALIGVFIFFYPFLLPHAQILGIIFLIGTLLFNSISTILGRFLNAQKIHSPLIITAISMLFGSIGLVFVSFLTELPHFITDIELIYIIILAFFNTALAFTLWNKAMRSLRAIDISLINNTMLPQITILSFVFLHENMNLLEFIGLSISFVTIIVLQAHNAIKEKNKTKQFENLK